MLMLLYKQISLNNSLAAPLGGGSSSQGGAQKGTGARGEQYLDGLARSHKLRALELFEPTPTAEQTIQLNKQNYLTNRPSFRSKPTRARSCVAKLRQMRIGCNSS